MKKTLIILFIILFSFFVFTPKVFADVNNNLPPDYVDLKGSFGDMDSDSFDRLREMNGSPDYANDLIDKYGDLAERQEEIDKEYEDRINQFNETKEQMEKNIEEKSKAIDTKIDGEQEEEKSKLITYGIFGAIGVLLVSLILVIVRKSSKK